MKHLYHEQTNTISSTSTSSSSSKHSQSKSNDTTTTALTNPCRMASPLHSLNSSRLNPIPTTLCFRNSAVANDSIDYHVYETIPSENSTYTSCTNHSDFRPVIHSNTHTIQPYVSRTNMFHHHPSLSKQSYDAVQSIPPSATVILPICCHHYSPQCLTGTLKQHPLPPPSAQVATHAQLHNRSESIVWINNIRKLWRYSQIVSNIKSRYTTCLF